MQRNDQRTVMLGEWEVKKVLIALAVPSIIGMVANGIYNVVDTIFVGRLGTTAIGAVSIVFPFFMIIAAVGLAVGVGAGSYISRLLGMGRKDEAEKTAMTAVVTVIGLGIAFSAAGQLWLEPILKLFGATETILPQAIEYSRALLVGAPIIMLKMTLNHILRAEGSAKASMVALIMGAVLNIILDPLFIFTFNLGVMGASAATVLAQACAAAYQFWFFLSGRSYLQLTFLRLQPSLSIYGQMIKIGSPIFITQFLNSAAMAMINTAAAPFGDGAVASMGIVKRVMSLAMFALFGFSQGFQPVAGFNYGARNFARLHEAIRYSLRVTTTFALAFTFVFVLFAERIVAVFSSDPEVLSIGSWALRAYAAPFAFLGYQLVYFALFQALGKAVPAAILSFARQGLILIPLILVLPRFFGLDGVILAQPGADALTAVITAFLAAKINRQLRLEAESTEPGPSLNIGYDRV